MDVWGKDGRRGRGHIFFFHKKTFFIPIRMGKIEWQLLLLDENETLFFGTTDFPNYKLRKTLDDRWAGFP